MKKKILVIAALPDSLITFRYHLLKTMVDMDHIVIACAAKYDKISSMNVENITTRLMEIGVVYHAIPLDRTSTNPLHDIRTFASLYTFCRHISPDVIFCYTAKPVIYGSIAGSLAGEPAIFSMLSGLGYGVATKSDHVGPATTIVRKLYKFALAKNRAVIFQNPDDRDAMLASGLLSSRMKTVIVNGAGVDISYYAQSPLPRDPITFLLIARLLREKGVREYARAAEIVKSRYPKVRFILVGPIESHPDSVKEDEVRSWEHAGILSWTGPISDVRPYLAEASVYVLPSYHEGTPRTVLEAMAMGRPVITTNAPGCRETVIDGKNGFLVPVQDVYGLTHAMEKFITDPALIDKMGQQSREIAVTKYDVHLVNDVMMRTMGLM